MSLLRFDCMNESLFVSDGLTVNNEPGITLPGSCRKFEFIRVAPTD